MWSVVTFLTLSAIICMCGHFQQVLAQQTPTISFYTKNRNASVGDTVDLHCSVLYASGYPVLWVKVNLNDQSHNTIISHKSTLEILDQRYSIRHDEASSTYTLQISKLQETDTGLYQCQVILSSSNKLTKNSWVTVRVPPRILDNSTMSISTTAGQRVYLECYAVGFPIPVISWRRENNDLLPTGGTVYRGNVLIIHNITKFDRGTYYCSADNGVGDGARRHISLEVDSAPLVTADQKNYKQALGFYVDLVCHVEGYPAPGVIWLKDQYGLNDNYNYHISTSKTGNVYTESTLRVNNIEKRNYGTYICQAYNKLGKSEAEIELYEVPYVVCPPACGIGLSGAEVSHHISVHLLMFMLILYFMVK